MLPGGALNGFGRPVKIAAPVNAPDVSLTKEKTWTIKTRRASPIKLPPPQPVLTPSAVLKAHGATAISCSVEDYCRKLITHQQLEDNTFHVVDLGVVQRLKYDWDSSLPRVRPHYAVKCNPNAGVISMLAALGACFDCASQQEIQLVLRCGVPPDRIIFAHPCKLSAHLRFAEKMGVRLTTFDTPHELRKIAALHPTSELLLRIRADDPAARCCLGNKYGAEAADAAGLLQVAKELGLRVVGVSFHVGSGAKNPAAFAAAIQQARAVFDTGTALGFDMHTLDLGGGFVSCAEAGSGALGDAVPTAINAALAQHFPSPVVRVIAEPGRYMVQDCTTIACAVNGMTSSKETHSNLPHRKQEHWDYWISDGIYGAFNCIQRDFATVQPRPLCFGPEADAAAVSSTLFGPTCDGLDVVQAECLLPRLQPGRDWVLFRQMGAYTTAGACDFNGFNVSEHVPVYFVNS